MLQAKKGKGNRLCREVHLVWHDLHSDFIQGEIIRLCHLFPDNADRDKDLYPVDMYDLSQVLQIVNTSLQHIKTYSIEVTYL